MPRSDTWVGNLKDINKQKEEEIYNKFEKEELEDRGIDEVEKHFSEKRRKKN